MTGIEFMKASNVFVMRMVLATCIAGVNVGCGKDGAGAAASSASPAGSAAPVATSSSSAGLATSASGAGSATIAAASASAAASAPKVPSDETVLLPKVDAAKPYGASLSEVKLDKFEVTVESYRKCVDAGCCVAHCSPLDDGQAEPLWREYCNYDKDERGKHPMNCVDWVNADAYCRWVGKRLPTDAEWLYAAHGEAGQKYPWGNSIPEKRRLNVCDPSCRKALKDAGRPWGALHEVDDGFPGTAPVGSFPDGVSRFGAMDMGGNVWEWLGDWFSFKTDLIPSKQDPTGALSGERRVVRGGSWNEMASVELENQTRHGFYPRNRFANVGFRCAELSTDTAEPGAVCMATASPKDFGKSSCRASSCKQFIQCGCDMAEELAKHGEVTSGLKSLDCKALKETYGALETTSLSATCDGSFDAYKRTILEVEHALKGQGISIPASCK